MSVVPFEWNGGGTPSLNTARPPRPHVVVRELARRNRLAVVAKDGLKASLIEDGAGTSPNRRAIAALAAPEGAARAVKRAGECEKPGTSLFG
jgi:hypothetical protein